MVALGQSSAARHRPNSRPQTMGGFVGAMERPVAPFAAKRTTSTQDTLGHAIRSTVLPRLRLTHGLETQRQDAGPSPSAEDVDSLFGLLLTDDSAGAAIMVERVRARGVGYTRLYLGLLAPVARQLGEAWEADRCDFSTVTLGTMRLQHLLRDYGPDFERRRPLAASRRRILLVSAPGEQHSFGRDMLAGFFRAAGWDVWDQPPRSLTELTGLVRQEAFAIIGLSAASDDRLDAVGTGIRAVRRASRNAEIGVMVGGPLFSIHPEYVAMVGADATAVDGHQATLQAERLLSLLASRA